MFSSFIAFGRSFCSVVISLFDCLLFFCACFLHADNRPVQRAAKVQPTEADGGKYIGIVILLVTLLPVGVLVILDLLKLIESVKQHYRQHSPKVATVI